MALAALAVYGIVGWWLTHYLHFAIGDSLARTANAKYMLFARDAHFAALGFVWMPIPTVSQLPAMLVLEPLGHAADAGWATTALWGAGTVLVLGRMCNHLCIPRVTAFLLVGAYALNPVVVYFAANGMSEGPLFFFVALTFLGLFRYLDRGDSAALLTAGLGAAGCALDRYEAIPLIFVVGGAVLLADLRRKGRHAALINSTLVLLPAVASVVLWFLYMKVIKGSFHAFIDDAAGNQSATTTEAAVGAGKAAAPAFGPVVHGPISINSTGLNPYQYTAHWMLAYAPALLLLPLIFLGHLRRAWGSLTLVTFGLFLPATTLFLLTRLSSAGDPRYFVSSIIVATVGVIFLAARINVPYLRMLVHPVLAIALLAGWVTGPLAQLDRNSTRQEQEWRVFDVLDGKIDRSDSRGILAWQAFTASLDAQLKPGELVLADVRFTFEAELYSTKPKQFIINNDEDYQPIVADPYRPGLRIDYLLLPAPGGRGLGADDAEATLFQAPAAWRLVLQEGPARLYQRITGSTGPRPADGAGEGRR